MLAKVVANPLNKKSAIAYLGVGKTRFGEWERKKIITSIPWGGRKAYRPEDLDHIKLYGTGNGRGRPRKSR